VQATGRDNARRATTRLRALGYLTADQDLERTPTLMLDADVAAAMLFVGLTEGWYTGKKLANFFGTGLENPTGARAMVNPDNNGAAIAITYRAFVNALRAAGHKPGGIVVAETTPAAPVAAKPGFFSRLLANLRTNMPPQRKD
jgi:putative chitinase